MNLTLILIVLFVIFCYFLSFYLLGFFGLALGIPLFVLIILIVNTYNHRKTSKDYSHGVILHTSIIIIYIHFIVFWSIFLLGKYNEEFPDFSPSIALSIYFFGYTYLMRFLKEKKIIIRWMGIFLLSAGLVYALIK